MLSILKEKNKNLSLFDLQDPMLQKYGRKVTGIPLEAIINDANQIPISECVSYQASHAVLEKTPTTIQEIENVVFGEMPIQIGICWGKNKKLNGLEWHRGSELIIAATDLVLLIASYNDFSEPNGKLSLDTKKVVGLFLQAGEAVELYPMVLHLAPCQTSDAGFRAVIILPKGTNEPLSAEPSDELLLAKNKWLVGHAEMRHTHTALTGENITLLY